MGDQRPEEIPVSLGEFPDQLKDLRRKKSLTQKDLADSVSVSQQTISAIEKGKIDPSLKLLGAIAAVLGIVLLIGAIRKGGGKDE